MKFLQISPDMVFKVHGHGSIRIWITSSNEASTIDIFYMKPFFLFITKYPNILTDSVYSIILFNIY